MNALLTLSAVGAVVVAALGLGTWKKQLKGKTHHDVAHRLLVHAYTLRDAIARHRQPVSDAERPGKSEIAEVNGLEMPEPHGSLQRKMTFVYTNRNRPVQKAKVAFEASVTRAEAFWGKRIRTAAEPLLECVNTLYHETNTYLTMFQDKEWHLSEDGKTARGVVQSWVTEPKEHNKFSDEIEAAVSTIEAVIKPHLKL